MSIAENEPFGPPETISASASASGHVQTRGRSRLYVKVLAAFAASGLALAAAEVGLLLAGRSWGPSTPPVCARADLFEEFAPHGYRLRPSREIRYRYPRDNPRDVVLVSDVDGFRNARPFDRRDERPRVLVLGDSFVFGAGVEESERFTNVLETLEPGWRVDNLGMSGFGTDLMLRALQEVGLTHDPDVVLFCVYTDDVRRVSPRYAGVGFAIPRFKLQAGRLITAPYPKIGLLDRSRVVQGIRHAWWKYSDALWDLNRAILDRVLELGRQHDFKTALVFLPGLKDTPTDKARRSWLREYARKHNAPFLDLTRVIHAADRRRIYLPGNPHWNSNGHLIAARELARFLARDVIGSE